MLVYIRGWLTRTVALLVAWCVLLLVASVLGTLLRRDIWPWLVLWLWTGLLLMLLKPHRFPLPSDEYVDVAGALSMMWWASRWPIRLLKKK